MADAAEVAVCNQALSEIGARVIVADFDTETTPAAQQCRLWYAQSRRQLLRAAPWGFARKTLLMTELGLATDTPNLVPYPWLVKYAYPTDCLKMRYILPPPFPPADDSEIDAPDVSSTSLVPWCGPSRQWRFLPGFEPAVDEEAAYRTLLANVREAYGVYTADVEEPDLWDSLFNNAISAVLAFRFVMPLTGNVKMKGYYGDLARAAVQEARGVDGNEAIPSSDHVVDWTAGRNGSYLGYVGAGPTGALGSWYDAYDLNWGM